MTNYIARGRSLVVPLQNDSAGTVGEGAVVVLTGTESFDVTTTPNLSTDIIGVALESIATTAIGRVCIGGYVEKINLNNTAGAGDYLYTTSVEKLGVASATLESGAFGQAVDSGATPSAILFINPVRFIDADPVWEAEGDILVGTGPNAAAIVSIGSAGEVLTVSGGTATWQPVDAGSVDLDLGFTAQGDILVGTGGDAWSALGIGDEGDVLTVSGGDATWAPASGSVVDFWFSAPYLAGYSTDGTYAIADSNSDNTFILLAGGYPNVHEGVFLETNSLTKTMTSMVAPYTGTIELYNVFLMYMGGAAGGNFKYKYDVQVLSEGATTYSDGAPGTQATIAVTNSQNEIVYNQMGTTYNVTAGDVITCRIQANRGDVADTAGDTIQIWTLAGKYTA